MTLYKERNRTYIYVLHDLLTIFLKIHICCLCKCKSTNIVEYMYTCVKISYKILMTSFVYMLVMFATTKSSLVFTNWLILLGKFELITFLNNFQYWLFLVRQIVGNIFKKKMIFVFKASPVPVFSVSFFI